MNDGAIPTKGQHIQLTCIVSNTDKITSVLLNSDKKCDCVPNMCLKYNDNGHICTIGGTILTVDIQQADRDDEGDWKCRTSTADGELSEKIVPLIVYSKN